MGLGDREVRLGLALLIEFRSRGGRLEEETQVAILLAPVRRQVVEPRSNFGNNRRSVPPRPGIRVDAESDSPSRPYTPGLGFPALRPVTRVGAPV